MQPGSNPKKRGYLLPKGCKDLIDVLNRKPGKAPASKNGRYPMNEEIRAPRVFVFNINTPDGQEMDLSQALELARSINMDLIEINSKAIPPICAIF